MDFNFIEEPILQLIILVFLYKQIKPACKHLHIVTKRDTITCQPIGKYVCIRHSVCRYWKKPFCSMKSIPCDLFVCFRFDIEVQRDILKGFIRLRKFNLMHFNKNKWYISIHMCYIPTMHAPLVCISIDVLRRRQKQRRRFERISPIF